MNDSPYGLTASIWTNAEANSESEKAFLRFVDELETGTVFLNRYSNAGISVECTNFIGILFRCDYLDPALAWTGVKDSGRGVSLSKFGMYFSWTTRSFSLTFIRVRSVDAGQVCPHED